MFRVPRTFPYYESPGGFVSYGVEKSAVVDKTSVRADNE